MSLVATETFEVEYEGKLETITAGITHVIEGHEIARRFPSKFKKLLSPTVATGAPRGGRRAPRLVRLPSHLRRLVDRGRRPALLPEPDHGDVRDADRRDLRTPGAGL